MWSTLPIQRYGRKDSGPEFECIRPGHAYPRYDNVRVSKWKDTDLATRAWALQIWRREFSVVRTPLHDTDYLIYVEKTSTLVARLGVWIGDAQTTRMVHVTLNYVAPEQRGLGIAGQMILSMAHDLTKELGCDVKFMFELHNVPPSLNDAIPFMRFSYTWVPFFAAEAWTAIQFPSDFWNKKVGFRPDAWAGYQLFSLSTAGGGEKHILFDPHDTVVWFTDFGSLLTFDKRAGANVRFFWSLGNVRVYAENMYFTPKHQTSSPVL